MLNEEILQYIQNHREEAYELLLTLARIPAPSNHEEKRARFCSEWLKAQGAEGVYVDEALNVVYPVEAGDHVPVEVYMATRMWCSRMRRNCLSGWRRGGFTVPAWGMTRHAW